MISHEVKFYLFAKIALQVFSGEHGMSGLNASNLCR